MDLIVFIDKVNLIGSNYFNYNISLSGITSANITPAPLTSNFYSLGEVYDRNSYAPVNSNLSGFYLVDNGSVNINSNWISNYRTINAGNNIPIDISNITINGASSSN